MNGQVVLITGAARGIGAAIAQSVAARGARVSLVGLEPDELERLAASLPDAAAFVADVTDQDAVDAAVAGTVERFGGLDVAVVNAGIAAAGVVRDADPEAFVRTVEVNLLGSYRTMRACLPHLMQRRGYLLQIASIASALQMPGMGAYCASKAGAESLARSVRAEVRRHGVEVGVMYPSWIDTELVRSAEHDPTMGVIRSSLHWPLKKSYPVERVGEAAAGAIAHRRKTIGVPRWTRAIVALRPLLWPVVDRDAQRFVEQLEGHAATAAVGPGGEAAMRAVHPREGEPA
jgi:NAD(P)-dependent dehydrogenase (short-subunit alcohol dehydrogenase family)